ncbi:MIP/aquaporin family protein [Leptothoe sp. PORK10 BA2]|uniref:MIP/aquaporin family protein n=1 Tax=Leptothoe sp. PORK10 BA2 TaxID=3110254 RepID=UPI002B2048FA|nr:aquaporin [Leptothoe sp. PORK10 BA2]MEA5462962.1 aquaporin [Leptothoe sp. PORK10 BA2]
MLRSLRSNWPEYLMEGAELGLFMILAGFFATLFYSPESPAMAFLPAKVRGVLMGLAMGGSAIAIIYSPWGKRSGAHFNPAVTLAFYRLGKLAPWDAFFYVVAQFIGGLIGVFLVAVALGEAFTNIPVNYIVTVPGIWHWPGALVTEALLAFSLMLMVLVVSNHPKLHQLTGVFAGILVALFVTVAAPISGMSINPARTFASALPAQVWTGFWIYYFVPPLAMLLAAELYLQVSRSQPREICGKLCPNTATRCICTDCPCQDLSP